MVKFFKKEKIPRVRLLRGLVDDDGKTLTGFFAKKGKHGWGLQFGFSFSL